MNCDPHVKLCEMCLRAWLDRRCPPRLEDTELWNRPPEEWCLWT